MKKIIAVNDDAVSEIVTVRTVTKITTVITQITVIEALDSQNRVLSTVPGGEHTHTHTQINTHLHHKD